MIKKLLNFFLVKKIIFCFCIYFFFYIKNKIVICILYVFVLKNYRLEIFFIIKKLEI